MFERATAWARGRYGIEIRAAAFDYRLTSLGARLSDVTVAARETPARPFLRIAELDLNLAASALRGRLNFDGIRVRHATIVLDQTTRPTGTVPAPTQPGTATTLPPFEVGVLQVEDLDLTLGGDDGTRLVVRQLSTLLSGREPGRLEGDIDVAGGIDVSFGTEAVRVAFDRAEARIVVHEGARAVGALTAFSPVGQLRIEGTAPLDAGGSFDLRYDATAQLEQSRRWWRDAPDWTGRAAVRGEVHGPRQFPEASFAVRSTDFAWSSLRPATVDAAGRVSTKDLALDAFSVTSRRATLEGRGRLAFADSERSDLAGRWKNIGTGVIAELLSLSTTPASRTALSGSATLGWSGPRPMAATIGGHLDATAAAASPDDAAIGTLVADGRSGHWTIDYRQSLAGSTRATFQGRVDLDEAELAESAVAGSIALHSRDVHAALVQLQRLGLPLPPTSGAVSADQLAFDGRVLGSLGPRA